MSKSIRLVVITLGLTALFLLGGCISVPPGSATILTQAKTMTPPQGFGGLYVFRPSLPPGDRLWGVNLDTKHLGYLAPKSFLYGILKPGSHSLDLEYTGSLINFDMSDGQNRYFKITPGFPGVMLSPIDANEARELMEKSTLSALSLFENDEIRRLFRDR